MSCSTHTPAISGLLWWASTVVKDITKECRNSHFSYQLYSQSGRICLLVLWTETWNNTQGGIWTTPLRNNLSVSAPLTWNSAPLYNGYRCDLGWARFNLQQFNLKKCRFNICTHLWQRTQLKSIWKVAKPWGEVVGYLFNSQVIQHSGSGSMLTSKVFCFCFFYSGKMWSWQSLYNRLEFQGVLFKLFKTEMLDCWHNDHPRNLSVAGEGHIIPVSLWNE